MPGVIILRSNYLKLNKILDVKKWQVLQDSLATITKMAIITVDHMGIPITTHSDPRPFCQYVRSNPNLVLYCHKCDSRAGLEAVRINNPFIYLCHCRIVDVAIPIEIDGKYVGAVMAGQVRLPDDETDIILEQILVAPDSGALNLEDVRRMYEAIPVLSYQEIEQSSRMLFNLCHYIVEEAMNKNLILEMYERMVPLKEEARTITDTSDYSFDKLEHLKKVIGSVVTNAYIKTPPQNQILCKNPTLKPAFDYIYSNKGDSISQKKMADLCNISTSHFSRLFAKEVGEPFSVFVARKKIEWSKQFLEKTELSITQVSDELGFSEPSYYIKTFKKYENITPSAYRRLYGQSIH